MKILIVGGGEVGTRIAQQLVEEGKDVIIIERDGKIAAKADQNLDCLVLHGDGTSIDFLKEAGAEDADVFIAVTSTDEVNLVCCFIVASEFKIPIKVARVSSIDYARASNFATKIAGVDYIINTEREAAWEIFQSIEQGANSAIVSFDNPYVQMREFHINEDGLISSLTIRELRGKLQEDFVIAGVIRDEELIVPHSEFKIQKGDVVYVATLLGIFYKLYKVFGSETHKMRKIVIIGGTTVGIILSRLLINKGRSVILVDKNYEKSKELAEILPEALVLNADISEPDIYSDEEIKNVDAVVSTTSNEELNIITGIYAKKIGVKRAISVVDKTNYLKLAANLGIDSIVSKKLCAIDSIVKVIRKGNVRSVHTVFDGRAEAIELVLPATSVLVDNALKDITLPPDCLILSVEHNRKTVIPDGNTVLKAGDSVVFFLKRSSVIAFEDLLN